MLSEKAKKDFTEFGERMHIIGILLAISFIPLVGIIMGFVILIFVIKASGNIRSVAFDLDNKNLHEFHGKYIIGYILKIIGICLFFLGAFWVIRGALIPFIITLISEIVCFVVGGIFEKKAWDNFNIFLKENQDLLPTDIEKNAINGSKNMNNAAICTIGGFLVIPLIVGYVFSLLGAFKLSSLTKLKSKDAQKTEGKPAKKQITAKTPKTQTTAKTPAISSTSKIFCPNCGSSVDRDIKFCGDCGSDISTR